ncbi:MAG: pilin [Bacillota bacterium]
MMRAALPLFLFTAFLVFQPAHAQTCTPACGEGMICVYKGISDNPNDTACIPQEQNGTVDELVVTGAPVHHTTFADLVYKGIVPFVDSFVIPFLYVLAFLFFLIGIVRYFFMGGEEQRQAGKTFVVWGLVGMVIIFGVWAIVRLLLGVIQ